MRKEMTVDIDILRKINSEAILQGMNLQEFIIELFEFYLKQSKETNEK